MGEWIKPAFEACWCSLAIRYLRIPGFLAPDETDMLLARSKQLLEDFNIDDHPLTKFTTSDNDHVGDEYFLTSGEKGNS
jgi:phytanoyl-CoA hydroxylase